MNETVKTPTAKRVIKKLALPLLVAVGIGGYITIAGKMGTCPACVAITDAVFGSNAEAVEQAVTPWSFPDLAGGTVNSDDYKGQVTVVTFWATWCPPCRKEIPALNTIHEKFAAQGVSVLGVSVDEDPDKQLGEKVQELGINYPVARGSEGIPATFGNISSIPTVFVFDRDQQLAFKHVGYLSEEKLEKQIQNVL